MVVMIRSGQVIFNDTGHVAFDDAWCNKLFDEYGYGPASINISISPWYEYGVIEDYPVTCGCPDVVDMVMYPCRNSTYLYRPSSWPATSTKPTTSVTSNVVNMEYTRYGNVAQTCTYFNNRYRSYIGVNAEITRSICRITATSLLTMVITFKAFTTFDTDPSNIPEDPGGLTYTSTRTYTKDGHCVDFTPSDIGAEEAVNTNFWTGSGSGPSRPLCLPKESFLSFNFDFVLS